MVVLIGGVSLAGDFAIRMTGARRGLAWTALLGGLVSSTAVALGYSRMGRDRPALAPLLAAGVVIASATMLVRTLAIAWAIEPELSGTLAGPLTVMFGLSMVGGLWLWRRAPAVEDSERPPLRNPFAIGSALRFGILLAAIMLLARALREAYGDLGIYLLAAGSGLVDVDPATLSLARGVARGLSPATAGAGILIAASVNTLLKGLLSVAVGGWPIGIRVLPIHIIVIAAGGGWFLLGR
jgi:uncharacterized membrane protein (DUF4010 family)